MNKIPCPACAADTADGLLCRDCTKRLRRNLAELPDLLDELATTATRQAVTGQGGGRTAEDPLPFDETAADQHWAIRNTLLAWVMTIELGDLRGLADDPADWCRWLAKRIERIRGHDEADMLVDEIDYCVKAARRAIDLPGDGILCGTCDICGKDVYAAPDAATAVCRRCDLLCLEPAEVPVGESRRSMIAEAEHRAVLTKREIIDVAPSYRLAVNSSTFSTWVQRGRLAAVEHRRGVPLYRLADALTLARKAKAEAEADRRRAEAEKKSA